MSRYSHFWHYSVAVSKVCASSVALTLVPTPIEVLYHGFRASAHLTIYSMCARVLDVPVPSGVLLMLHCIMSVPCSLVLCVCLLVGCLTSQQQASVSQGRICEDNLTCCHTEIEVADQTFYLTQSQYTDTGLTSPSADPITPGAWQSSHWSTNF